MPGSAHAGVWFVATGWEPEPVLDASGNVTNQPRCFAAALALSRRAMSITRGRLRFALSGHGEAMQAGTQPAVDVAELCRLLASPPRCGVSLAWHWPWGGTLTLEASPHVVVRAAAA
jgi:hypothetical protein